LSLFLICTLRLDDNYGMSSSTDPVTLPDPPATATEVFGERLPLARRYAELLATDGIVRGLIGPREAPRLWDRHLLNCAVLAERIPSGVTVADVGSGAGLPGIVLGVARPDLRVVLIEPLARRSAFLEEAVDELALEGVSVLRARAEELTGRAASFEPVDVVTARAVAPLDRLAGWCLPLLVPGGRVLAMKGSTAEEEVAEHAAAVRRRGGSDPVVVRCGEGVVDPPTTVVEFVRTMAVPGGRRGGR
jgi:16S rRNA (guanine527-N7)-methyltransferase